MLCNLVEETESVKYGSNKTQKYISTKVTPTWHNTPADFHKGRHIVKSVIS